MYNTYYVERMVQEYHAQNARYAPRRASGPVGADIPRMGVGRVFESWRRIVEGGAAPTRGTKPVSA
jgi:hypothetical protein